MLRTSKCLGTKIVSLVQGQIKGALRKTIYDQLYYSFEGIPFAQPPVGNLRFKPPLPAKGWEGVRDGTECANKPMQRNQHTGKVEGDEDCLYLNVYTKTLTSEKPQPVMVWIYGGGFCNGSADRQRFGPDYLMRERVVLVTFNYRLCSLGFLSLCDPNLDVPGNVGLKDQVMALKWVNENIEKFNGDPQNITLFGESAGGACTHYMSITEQARGLFHKFIPMSGVVLNEWALSQSAENCRDMGYRLAKSKGYTGPNVDSQVLEFLCNLDAHELVNHNLVEYEDQRNGQSFAFVPSIEPYEAEHCVIPKQPIEMIKTAWSNSVPMLIGGTSSEGLVMYPYMKSYPHMKELLAEDPEFFLPIKVRSTHSHLENTTLSRQLVRLYFEHEKADANDVCNFVDIFSHKLFWDGIQRTILLREKYAKAPTYLYRFDFDSPDFNRYRKLFCGDDPVRGAAHADDVCYLFHAEESWKLAEDSPEFRTIHRMVGIWTAFARNSNPNCPEIGPNIWQPLHELTEHSCLNISDKVKLMRLPERSKLQLWQSFYKEEDLG